MPRAIKTLSVASRQLSQGRANVSAGVLSAEREYERSSQNVQLLRQRQLTVFAESPAGNFFIAAEPKSMYKADGYIKKHFFFVLFLLLWKEKVHRPLLLERDTFALFFPSKRADQTKFFLKRKNFSPKYCIFNSLWYNRNWRR